MTIKPTLWALLCVVVLAGLFSGCQSSKIAFGNSYYFKQAPKTVKQDIPSIDKLDTHGTDLYASLEREVLVERDASNLLKQAQQQLQVAVDKSDNEQLKASASRMSELAGEMNGQMLTKKETRAKRKELRKELRSLAKEYKAMSPNKANDMERSLLLSIIFGGAGLLFLFIVPVLGLLFLLASIVLLVIWAANE